MDMGESPQRRIIDLRVLECPVCLETFCDPRILTACGHTVCADCLRAICNPSADDGVWTVDCPSCRRVTQLPGGIDGLAVNFATADVIDALHEGPDELMKATSCPRSTEHIKPPGCTPAEAENSRTQERKKSGEESERASDSHLTVPAKPISRAGSRAGRGMSKRSLSCPDIQCLLDVNDGEQVIVSGDGWHAAYTNPNGYSLCNSRVGDPRRSSIDLQQPSPQVPEMRATEDALRMAAESLAVAELQEAIEMAAGSQSSSVHVAMPVSPPPNEWRRGRRCGISGRGVRDELRCPQSVPLGPSMPRLEPSPVSSRRGIRDELRCPQSVPLGPSMPRLEPSPVSSPRGHQSQSAPSQISISINPGDFDDMEDGYQEESQFGDRVRRAGALAREQELLNEGMEQAHGHRLQAIDRSQAALHPSEKPPKRGECCVGGSRWSQALTWMGLLSLDIG